MNTASHTLLTSVSAFPAAMRFLLADAAVGVTFWRFASGLSPPRPARRSLPPLPLISPEPSSPILLMSTRHPPRAVGFRLPFIVHVSQKMPARIGYTSVRSQPSSFFWLTTVAHGSIHPSGVKSHFAVVGSMNVPSELLVRFFCTSVGVFACMSSTWQYACCAFAATPLLDWPPAVGLPHCMVTHERSAVSSHSRSAANTTELDLPVSLYSRRMAAT